jgi:two-component system sensor histidine kinase BarA
MFEAFKQESTGLSREYEGSGLGLSLVKELVDQHDGSLDVDSAPGDGTTMSVRLPLHQE